MIGLRFGLTGRVMTQRDIGRSALGLSEASVCLIEKRAMGRLRERLARVREAIWLQGS